MSTRARGGGDGPGRRIGDGLYAADGFAVLRAPLLPLDEYLAWNDGLPSDLPFPERCRRLRRRLAGVFRRPEVAEALHLASPDLRERLDDWLADPERGDGEIELALIRYFQRMTCRPTPFGLFASCSVVGLSRRHRLELAGHAGLRRVSRLDMDYLQALMDAVAADAGIRRHLRFYPNDSLYRLAGRLCYVESRVRPEGRSHHLVSVVPDPYLEAALAAATGGATPGEIAGAVAAVDEEVEREAALAYVDELIGAGLLVSELQLPVTGREPLPVLLEQLAAVPGAQAIVDGLRAAAARLAACDRKGTGNPAAVYTDLARDLSALPARVDRRRLVQVDLWRAMVPGAGLAARIAGDVLRGVALLQRLSYPPVGQALSEFRRAFRERYEDREVPLTEVLDEDHGIGFLRSGNPAAGGAPLLERLPLGGGHRAAAAPAPPAHPLHSLLLERLHRCLVHGEQEIVLTDADLDRQLPARPAPLPDAFAAIVVLEGGCDADPVRDPTFRIHLRGVSGPSGARLLGRFCHLSPELTRLVREHLRREEALRPEAIFAEVVHLPEGRTGNILFRPLLREYEIPYLGRAGVDRDHCLPLRDLLLSVRGERIVLRSRRLGREVVPRLTTAHNYLGKTTGLYRLLGMLQGQDSRLVPAWSWGALEGAPFLPRVRYGRVVLSPARWRVPSAEAADWLAAGDGERRFAAVTAWARRHRLPRLVEVAEGDNTLTVDLANPLAVAAMVDLLARHRGGELREAVAATPATTPVIAAGRAYRHELVIPFTRRTARSPDEGGRRQEKTVAASPRPVSGPAAVLRHPPGGSWLYARLACGEAAADTLLRDHVRPLVAELEAGGIVDRWFFIRYGDPHWHLRLRLHGRPERLAGIALPALHDACREPLASGLMWRLSLDTYVPEVRRYGGVDALPVCEELFHHDSAAVLALLADLVGDAAREARWLLVLRGVHDLFADLALPPAAVLAVTTRLRDTYSRELGGGKALKKGLGRLHREHRATVAWLLGDREEGPGGRLQELLAAGVRVLRSRTRSWREAMARLRALDASGRLAVSLPDLAASLAHMHANRMFRTAARAQEMVVHDLLGRAYRERQARGKTR